MLLLPVLRAAPGIALLIILLIFNGIDGSGQDSLFSVQFRIRVGSGRKRAQRDKNGQRKYKSGSTKGTSEHN